MEIRIPTGFRKKENYVVIVISLVIFMISLLFRQDLYGVFGEKNYLTIHLIMGILITTISLTIAIQSWLVFPYTLSSYRLYIGPLFFSLSILEIAHVITFKGMPFFLSESSVYKSTWFFIVCRSTEIFGLLAIVISQEKPVSSRRRLPVYIVSVLYSVLWLALIFSPSHFFPDLVKEGVGTTALKNNLQYGGIILQLVMIYLAAVRFHLHEDFNLMLIVASIYLITSDYFFTAYKTVYDINNFTGHWLQLAGYYFLQRAVYHTSVEEPFEKQRAALARIQYMAFHDELTRLPNRRLLSEKWTIIKDKQPQKKAALLVLDIYHFNKINEAFGYSFGDLILQGAALRVQESLSAKMVLGRVTADEFAILLPEVEDQTEIIPLIEEIQNSFQKPLQAKHLLLNVKIRMGAAMYPTNGADFEDLVQRADLALIEAQQGGHFFQFYQTDMDVKAMERLVIENDLYYALPRNELYLVYQPQVDISTGDLIGIEALLRWQHPEKGLLPPDKFIPIAEETGMIIPIGTWVLQTACRQIKEWNDMGLPQLTLAVNLSTRQFYQQNLVETVKKILDETQIPPQCLELEITESMMIDVEYTMKTLVALKQLGIRMAIDDFGTGYSSLSYLKDLPVDRLKIDKSFVRDLDGENTSVVSMIISLAKLLHIEVIAEGVETDAQKDILHNQGCFQIQGFLFSPPIALQELTMNFDSFCAKVKTSSGESNT